jgi:cytochrome b pre-mRNA-processing protein 3
LYGAIVAQARAQAFYADLGVPDTLEGRFDMIVLHLALVLRRIRAAGAPVASHGQPLFDRFCKDLDDNLREMGVGDLTVPKKMRRFGEAFYGRAEAYDRALAQDDRGALAEALSRNVMGEGATPSANAVRLADYVRAASDLLERASDDDIGSRGVVFPDPVAIQTPVSA